MAGIVKLVLQMDDQGSVQVLQQVEGQMNRLPPALERVGSKGNVVFTGLAKDQERAHDAARLLGRTLGVELPRQLDKFLARSSVIGPVLSAAFNAAIVLAFAVAIVQTIPKLASWIDGLRGINEELERQKQLSIEINRILLGDRTAADLAKNIAALVKERSALQDILRPKAAPSIGDLLFTPDSVKAAKERLADIAKDLERMEKEQAETRVREGEKAASEITAANKAEIAQRIADEATSQKSFEENVDRRMKLVELENQERTANHKQALDEIERMEKALAERQKEADSFLVDVRKENTAATLDDIGRIRQAEAERLADLEGLYAEALVTESQYGAAKVQITQTATASIEEIERNRLKQTSELQQRQLHEWQAAVQQMSHAIQSFMDNPIQYLKNLWKRFIANMIAEWIVGMRSMQGGGAGAGQGGGFSLGGLLGGLFGIGNRSGGGGGGIFSGRSGATVGGITLPPGVQPTFPSGGAGGSRFQFGQFTPGVAGLAGLPFSAGGGVGTGTMMGAGSAAGAGAKLGFGALLKANLPMLLASGGLLGAGAVGFGGPGRGALAGGLMGAGLIGALFPITQMIGTAGMTGLTTASTALLGPLGIGILAASVLIGLLMGKSAQNKKKRQAMDILTSGRAEWDRVIADYKSFRIPYESAIGGITQVWQQMVQQWANPALGKYGGIAIRNNQPEYERKMQEMQKIESERQARAQLQFGPSQFERGGFVGPASAFGGPSGNGSPSGFGPLGISLGRAQRAAPLHFQGGGEVPAILHAGEFVMNRRATRKIGRGNLESMNAGSSGGGPVIQIIAWDGESVDQWLRSGGAKKIAKAFRRGAYEGGL